MVTDLRRRPRNSPGPRTHSARSHNVPRTAAHAPPAEAQPPHWPRDPSPGMRLGASKTTSSGLVTSRAPQGRSPASRSTARLPADHSPRRSPAPPRLSPPHRFVLSDRDHVRPPAVARDRNSRSTAGVSVAPSRYSSMWQWPSPRCFDRAPLAPHLLQIAACAPTVADRHEIAQSSYPHRYAIGLYPTHLAKSPGTSQKRSRHRSPALRGLLSTRRSIPLARRARLPSRRRDRSPVR